MLMANRADPDQTAPQDHPASQEQSDQGLLLTHFCPNIQGHYGSILRPSFISKYLFTQDQFTCNMLKKCICGGEPTANFTFLTCCLMQTQAHGTVTVTWYDINLLISIWYFASVVLVRWDRAGGWGSEGLGNNWDSGAGWGNIVQVEGGNDNNTGSIYIVKACI